MVAPPTGRQVKRAIEALGQRVVVAGRVAGMIALLVKHYQEIDEHRQGSLTIDWHEEKLWIRVNPTTVNERTTLADVECAVLS